MSNFARLLLRWLFGSRLWAFLAFLASFPFVIFWNWLVPEIFSLPEIDLLQGFGILLLVGLLTRTHVEVSLEA
jgi:hypothetical protein